MTEKEILETLSGQATSPVTRAVIGLIEDHARAYHEKAVAPEITLEARQYFAGAAYALDQTKDVLTRCVDRNFDAR
jgi:hypothetical protein